MIILPNAYDLAEEALIAASREQRAIPGDALACFPHVTRLPVAKDVHAPAAPEVIHSSQTEIFCNNS